MNGKILTGSICMSDLIIQLKKGHTAFTKGKNGKLYFNFTQFINDVPDQYGNDSSLLLNSKDQKSKEVEGKVYFGNAKYSKRNEPTPVSKNDIDRIIDDLDMPSSLNALDDLPF
jgi:hypothetical protein